jgi:N-carbamoyl-L-amino-acid hydrolase
MGSGLSEAARAAAAAVDEGRLWQALMDVAAIGARPDGGVCRHALSDEDIEARARLIGWAEARGHEASVDEAANLFIRRAGREPDAAPVLAGSHLDSQPAGGRFDGVYGVLAGLEALVALDEAGVETERPIDIVAWTNEEGGRFDRSCTGSSIWAGASELESYLGDIGADGVRLGEALAKTLAATPDLPRRPRRWPAHAFIEPHIEQGPVLEAEGVPIAAVTGIQGVRWMNVEVSGKAGHAGTTPMAGRHDAVQAAVRAIAALNDLMADAQDLVRFTVGRVNVTPNSPNTIPEKVLFSIDFRHPDKAKLEMRGGRIGQVVRKAAAPCDTRLMATLTMDPAPFPEPMIALIEAAANGLGLGCRRLASGAFHDALYAAKVCPTAMIFIPCRDGLSHHPAEWAEPRHCADGARVLAATLIELASD